MSNTNAAQDAIEIGGICVLPEGLRPAKGNLSTLVRAEDVKDIVIRHGLRSHHPIAQIFFGLALASIGWLPLRHLVRWFQHGGVLLDAEVWLIVIAAYGLYLSLSTFSRSYFLQVRTRRANQKLCFRPGTEPAAVEAMLKALRDRGFSVSRDVDLSV